MDKIKIQSTVVRMMIGSIIFLWEKEKKEEEIFNHHDYDDDFDDFDDVDDNEEDEKEKTTKFVIEKIYLNNGS